MKTVPSDYDLDLYDFLSDEFKVQDHENISVFTGEVHRHRTLSGLGESFNLTYGVKKTILNQIYWLVVDKYPNLSEGQIRKTIRVFLNEQYN